MIRLRRLRGEVSLNATLGKDLLHGSMNADFFKIQNCWSREGLQANGNVRNPGTD
jgi:hypothetical protein